MGIPRMCPGRGNQVQNERTVLYRGQRMKGVSDERRSVSKVIVGPSALRP
jgi:hypothetical protein